MAIVINKVKVTHQGEGHIKVKVKYLHPFKFYAAQYSLQAGGLHATEMLLVFLSIHSVVAFSSIFFKLPSGGGGAIWNLFLFCGKSEFCFA